MASEGGETPLGGSKIRLPEFFTLPSCRGILQTSMARPVVAGPFTRRFSGLCYHFPREATGNRHGAVALLLPDHTFKLVSAGSLPPHPTPRLPAVAISHCLRQQSSAARHRHQRHLAARRLAADLSSVACRSPSNVPSPFSSEMAISS